MHFTKQTKALSNLCLCLTNNKHPIYAANATGKILNRVFLPCAYQTAQTQQDSRHSFASYEQQGSAEEWTYSNPDPHRVRGGSWLLALKSLKVRWGWDLALPCSPLFLHTCKFINFILPITIPFLCSLI